MTLLLLQPAYASETELHRLRLSAPATVAPGDLLFLTVLADHAPWDGATISPESLRLKSYAFGLSLPPGLTFESAELAGTDAGAALGAGVPFKFAATPREGGVTVGVFLSANGGVSLPAGTSQSILRIVLAVAGDAPSGPMAIEFTPSLADPTYLLAYLFQSPTGSPPPPAPFPNCEVDPTADLLECESEDACVL